MKRLAASLTLVVGLGLVGGCSGDPTVSKPAGLSASQQAAKTEADAAVAAKAAEDKKVADEQAALDQRRADRAARREARKVKRAEARAAKKAALVKKQEAAQRAARKARDAKQAKAEALRLKYTYGNCESMNAEFPHGVGRDGARDITKSGDPVTNFEVNALVYSYNASSDRDDDGIACEQG